MAGRLEYYGNKKGSADLAARRAKERGKRVRIYKGKYHMFSVYSYSK